MLHGNFPVLNVSEFISSRDALAAYSKILGAWLRSCRARRKHWWHISLRPSLIGLTTGVVYTESVNFELELNLNTSCLMARTSAGKTLNIELHGQASSEPAATLQAFLLSVGVPANRAPDINTDEQEFPDYSTAEAQKLHRALASVSALLVKLRAGIREETSPIGLWPHHFDLAMLWLPGNKIPGQDPANEEYADVQMNVGFTFGDEMVPEPYFYTTAYPLPEGFPASELTGGAEWFSDGFTGMVWRYRRLLENDDPAAALLSQWASLIDEGRQSLKPQSI